MRLWDITTRTPIGKPLPTGHTGDLAFSPDGALLATTGQDDRRIRCGTPVPAPRGRFTERPHRPGPGSRVQPGRRHAGQRR
ncbi:WD40 repeat domain-containing protein [Streptosporangium saharense]|uniref:WD40 repeat domain-containing protein n=1 Tax=Streptosporangium saharense TaxID=1706840 RepID=UPI0033246152